MAGVHPTDEGQFGTLQATPHLLHLVDDRADRMPKHRAPPLQTSRGRAATLLRAYMNLIGRRAGGELVAEFYTKMIPKWIAGAAR